MEVKFEVEDGYEWCYHCGGTGLALDYSGEPDECLYCGGSAIIEKEEDV